MALRYFNAAGGDPEAEIGEDHDPETHLVPLVIQTALGLKPFVEVYGTDYPTPDGTAIRDDIHVMDLADAHLRGLSCLTEGGESAALNLGTGTGHSVREVIATVASISGRSVPVHEAARRAGDPPVLVADGAPPPVSLAGSLPIPICRRSCGTRGSGTDARGNVNFQPPRLGASNSSCTSRAGRSVVQSALTAWDCKLKAVSYLLVGSVVVFFL